MPRNDPKPFTYLLPNVLDCFWRHVIVGAPDECWLWFGYAEKGYGKIRSTSEYGDYWWTVTRIAYYIGKGVDPGPLCVLHKCDNPPCVNWNHLFLGTKADNNRDRHLKGRTVMPTNRAFGAANARSKLYKLNQCRGSECNERPPKE